MKRIGWEVLTDNKGKEVWVEINTELGEITREWIKSRYEAIFCYAKNDLILVIVLG